MSDIFMIKLKMYHRQNNGTEIKRFLEILTKLILLKSK
jgi:hypothetical protein